MTRQITDRAAVLALAASIAEATDCNDHTGAMILLAEHFNLPATDRLATSLRSIYNAHMERGSLSVAMRGAREMIFEHLKGRASYFFTPEQHKLVMCSF
jgi:hypothetical protein